MDQNTSMTANHHRPVLLINRDFTLLWSGQAISYIGDFVFDITLLLWIASRIAAGRPWAPLAVSGVLLAVMVPQIFLGPIAGVFVDRWDKRRTMLAMDAVRAALILLLLPATGLVGGRFLGHPTAALQLAAIYTTVVLATVCQQFFGPARIALIGDIVSSGDRARASAMSQITMAMAAIVGPPLAAPLLFGVGVQWALVVNAFSFLVSFIAISLVHAPPSAQATAPGQHPNVWREFNDGLRFYAGNRVLVTILVAGVLAMLGAGAMNALDIFFVTINLHTSAHLYGWLATSFGAGSLLGGLLASAFAKKISPARMLWGGLLLGGLGIIVYSRLTSFLPAVILLGLVGVPIAGLNVAVMPLLLAAAPRELIGRVSAVLSPAISLASIGSIAVAGLLVSTVLNGFHTTVAGIDFGPVDLIFSAAGIMCVAGGVYAFLRLRDIDAAAVPTDQTEQPTSAEAAAG
jgi:MFS family permease